MTLSGRFDAISPMDHRFYGGDPRIFALLHPFLSERAAIAYKARVEGALARAMADEDLMPRPAAEAIAAAAEGIDPLAVAEEETRTRHDVRALVNVIREGVPDDAKRFVHLGATSYDIVDTANALRYRECIERAVVPSLAALVARCIALAEAEADTPQIGRTHGRHAEPITFGFAMAEYVARLGDRTEALRAAAGQLRGKLSGAVGAYSALGLLAKDPRELERRFLASLGLQPATHSTQIVPPEPWSDLAHACVTALGVMANLADDMRQLQRSEIGEVAEAFAPDQVGSSTMPHKRNPVSFENVKSIWKAMAPRVMTTYLDQISEHQRDLTNSASQRFLGEILAATAYAARRLADSLEGVRVDRERLSANLASARGAVVAEPLYVLLAKYGHPDAHEVVRTLTLEAERSGRTVLEVAELDPGLRATIAKMTPAERRLLERPDEYRGLSADVAREVCATWRRRLAGVLPE
ncbi:MAG TPA: lyase family protein [Candidatus Limnocylindrales bacterium]|nr:lyase family protein [Candidatus Limnocylindrales bacterium]